MNHKGGKWNGNRAKTASSSEALVCCCIRNVFHLTLVENVTVCTCGTVVSAVQTPTLRFRTAKMSMRANSLDLSRIPLVGNDIDDGMPHESGMDYTSELGIASRRCTPSSVAATRRWDGGRK